MNSADLNLSIWSFGATFHRIVHLIFAVIVCLAFIQLSDAATEKPVRDTQNGALVWRPYAGKIQWTGGKDFSGFATGRGTLSVFDKNGRAVAIFTGNMLSGRLVGDVSAVYTVSPDRASYEGGFSNWSENGQGVMTFRNGRKVAGIWLNGELQSELPMNQAPAVQNVDASAETRLQSTYDALKVALQGQARDDLITFQRAWINYKQQALNIANSVWAGQPDQLQRVNALGDKLAHQRSDEINFVRDALNEEAFPPPPDRTADALTEDIKTRLKALASQVGSPQVSTLADQWTEAAKLAQIVGAARLSPNEITNATLMHRHRALDHLFEVIESLQSNSAKPLSSINPAPSMPSIPASTEPTAEELAKLTTEAAAAMQLATDHWKAGKQPVTEMPAPLPETTQEKLSALNKTAAAWSTEVRARPGLEFCATLPAVVGMNEALRDWRTEAADVMPKLALLLESLPEKENALREWWRQVMMKAEANDKRTTELISELGTKLKTQDYEAVTLRITEAIKLRPQAGQKEFNQLVKCYSTLLSDKSLRASDADWTKPTLPARAVLEDLIKASDAYNDLPDSKLKEALTPCINLKQAAVLLLAFLNDYEPAGELDSAHPITALQKAKSKESWTKLMQSSEPELKPVADRLKTLDELIKPKLTEYEALIQSADKAEQEQKYLQAGELLRKAWLLDKQAALLERARKCEGKASGL
jgi:uncharacterized protein YecT (DUF1311 family)